MAAFLALLLLAAPPQGPWETVHVPENGAYGVRVATGSVERDGARRTAWVRTDWLKAGADGITRLERRSAYDCAARTAQILEVWEYGPNGEASDHYAVLPGERPPERAEPGSDIAFVLDFLCR